MPKPLTEVEKIEKYLLDWKDEATQNIRDIMKITSALDEAVTIVKESERKWWVEYKTPIVLLLSLFALALGIVVIGYSMRAADICTFSPGANGLPQLTRCK